MTTAQKAVLLMLVTAMALPGSLAAQTIAVIVAGTFPNRWDVGSFGPGDVSLPGNNFTNDTQPVLPATQTVDINVNGYPPGQWVRVLISKAVDEATTWNSQYTLWVRIVDGGTGTGDFEATIAAWTPITTAETQMFRVRRNRTGITVQLELRNLTAFAGTTTYSPSFLTTVTYTARRP